MQQVFYGVDGCRAGWFAVGLTADGGLTHAVYERFTDFWQCAARRAALILVDMPIGLPEHGQRACDHAARACLKARRASIFITPTRAAVYADAYAAANEINRAHGGKGISKQAWNITRKIRELDALLRTTPRAAALIRESHPEIAFWALAAHEMAHGKKSAAGHAERLAVLTAHNPRAPELYADALKQYRRKDAAPDDVLDAWVLAVTAQSAALVTLPHTPPHDAYGLPMGITYRG